MPRSLVTAPAVEPMTTAEAKLHLRVDVSDDDALIATLVKAARGQVEARTNRALVTQTWRVTLAEFPSDGVIRLPLPPLQSVTSVTYRDENGDTQTLSTDDYIVVTGSLPGAIHLAADADWPTTETHPEAVTVVFVCGYGDASDVPADLIAAQYLILGDLYANRSAQEVGTIITANKTVDALLAPHRYLEAV